MCLHVHFVLLAKKVKEDTELQTENIAIDFQADIGESQSVGLTWKDDLQQAFKQDRIATMELQMSRQIPYAIPVEILVAADSLQLNDLESTLIFEPSETTCILCLSPLGASVFQQGADPKNKTDFLLTRRYPFHRIHIKVKKCLNSSCGAMNQIFPYTMGELWYISCFCGYDFCRYFLYGKLQT